MKRAILVLSLLLVASARLLAIGPPVVRLTTDAARTKYDMGGRDIGRAAVLDWFSNIPRGSASQVIVLIDGSTPLFTACDFLTDLKRTAGVREFFVEVGNHPKSGLGPTVTYRFTLTAEQLSPDEHADPPPESSPDAVLQSLKPWIPRPPKLPAPK